MRIAKLTRPVSGSSLEVGKFYILNDHHLKDLINAAQTMDAFETLNFKDEYREYDGSDLTGKKLIAMRTGGAGDILFMTPAMKYLKQKYPTADLNICCFDKYTELIEDNPYLTKAIKMPILLDEWKSADYHLIFEGIIENNKNAESVNAYDLFLQKFKIDNTLLTAKDKIPIIVVNKDADALVRAKLEKTFKRRIGIHVRASAPIRTPDQERILKVAQYYYEQAWDVILFCSPYEYKGLMNDIKYYGLNKNNFLYSLDITGNSWKNVIALVNICDVMMCPDSSIVHIAAGLNKPIVALYGPFSSDVRLKYYNNTIALDAKPPCAPCFLGNQEIIVEKNIVKLIAHISPGDKVLTHKGRFMPVTKVFNRKVVDEDIGVINIKGIIEPLKATMEHPIAVFYYKDNKNTECFTEVSQIKKLIDSGINVYIKYFNYNVYVDLAFIQMTRTLEMNNHNFAEENMDIIINELEDKITTEYDQKRGLQFDNKLILTTELFKFFGFFVAKGRIGVIQEANGSVKHSTIDIEFKNDEVKNEIINLFGYIFNVSDHLNKIIDYKYESKSSNNIMIIDCDTIARFLRRLFGSVSFNDRIIPRWFFGLNKRSVAAFLSGFEKAMGSDEQKYAYSRNNRYVYSLAIMQRVLGNIIDVVNVPNFRKQLKVVNNDVEKIEVNNEIYLKIDSIAIKKYTGDVYNLEVDEDNTYVAKTFVAHNCFTHGHDPCILGLPSPCFQLIKIEDMIDAIQEQISEHRLY